MAGKNVGPFRIESQIGIGMVQSFLAVHETTGRPVFLKVAKEDAPRSGVKRSWKHIESTIDLTRHLCHPNIVGYVDSGHSEGLVYLAKEYIAGPSLSELLAARRAFPWPEVVRLGIQIGEALDYLRQQGVVHRNLKPSNLLLNERGDVKLIGFGIAIATNPGLATPDRHNVVGTIAYMSPEQATGKAIGHQADLYALGATLYHLLAGRPPFQGDLVNILFRKRNDPPPEVGIIVPDVPASLNRLISQLMAKWGGDRPEDAAAVAHFLSQVAAGDSPALPLPRLPRAQFDHDSWSDSCD